MENTEPLNVPSQVGEHLVAAEGDDLLVFRLHGDLRPEAARELIRLDRALARRNGYALILVDCRDLRSFDAQTRNAAFAEMKRDSGYVGSTAMFGASGTIPWIIKLMLRALGILSSHIDDETQLFDTEAQARAFIEKRRPKRKHECQVRRRVS